MKNSVVRSFGLGFTLLGGALASVQAKPIVSNNVKITEQKIKVRPDIKISESKDPNRKKIGATFRLKLWVNPTGTRDRDTSDSALDVLENYGKLQINGQTCWEIRRVDAYKGENAIVPTFGNEGILPISEDRKHNGGRNFEFTLYNSDKPADRKLAVSLRLYDSDTRGDDTSVDDMWGSFDYTYDPLKTGPGDWYWVWDSGDGLSSRFFVKIEKVEDIYESNSLLKPQVGPAIVKPLVPGKIPVPGPVIKRAPKRVEVR